MNVVEEFKEIASQDRFNGWPLEGGYVMGAKIPYFGQVMEYDLRTNAGVEHYASIQRHFGWAVVMGVTDGEPYVPTLVQWKPGVNRASWELPPGGIGKTPPDISEPDLLAKTQEAYKRETGYGGGVWEKLGTVGIETGKYRGAGPDDHGLSAHLYLAQKLIRESESRQPAPNEIMETLEVPLNQAWDMIQSGLFTEASALPCVMLGLLRAFPELTPKNVRIQVSPR